MYVGPAAYVREKYFQNKSVSDDVINAKMIELFEATQTEEAAAQAEQDKLERRYDMFKGMENEGGTIFDFRKHLEQFGISKEEEVFDRFLWLNRAMNRDLLSIGLDSWGLGRTLNSSNPTFSPEALALFMAFSQGGKAAYKAKFEEIARLHFPKPDVAEKIDAQGDYKGKISFADGNSSMSRYTITISDLHIIIDDKNQATGTVEFLMEYPKDGMLVVCSEFKGKVNYDNLFTLSGRVKETGYPKCKDNCCTYELIKQGSPCFKMSKFLYWHFDGKVKITPLKKELEGTIVVTPSMSPPEKAKPVMKYSVSTL